MDFSDSVLLAAALTLSEIAEEAKEAQISSLQPLHSQAAFESNPSAALEFDPAKELLHLAGAAQKLTDQADKQCGTSCDISGAAIVPHLISGVLFQAINSCMIPDAVKIASYDFAVRYSCLEDVSSGKFLFPSAGSPLAEALGEVTNSLISFIMIAAYRGENPEGGTKFVSMLADFLLQVETVICRSFSEIVFPKRLPVPVLEKAASVYEDIAREGRG